MADRIGTLNERDLVLCVGTLGNPNFSELVAAARAGGFNAISMIPSTYRKGRFEEKLSDSDMRHLLADNGLRVAELDPLLNWVPGHVFKSSDASVFDADEEFFYGMAEALEARSLNAVWALPERLPVEVFVDAFGALCDRAAAHGLPVHLEFLPWAQINNAQTAVAIAQQTGRANAGVMFDSWHHFRSNTANAVVGKLPGDKIFAVQLNDAPARAETDVIAETMQRRLLPGEGDIDLAGIIRHLDAIGSKAPLGVEIFSTELQKLPAEEIGRRAGASVKAILARARS
jgi:sugar phosphate isomerase/epimerase